MAKTGAVRVEDLLLADLVRETGDVWTREYRPTELRKWTVDIVCIPLKVAIEVDGRTHLRAKQYRSDCEKANLLTARGWRVLRYPASSVLTKKRRYRIVDQVVRVMYRLSEDDSDTCVLNGD